MAFTNHSFSMSVQHKLTKHHQNLKTQADQLRVVKIEAKGDSQFLVLRQLGAANPILVGSRLEVYRKTDDSIVTTAQAVVKSFEGKNGIAQITENSSAKAQILLPDYPHAMVGDFAKIKLANLSRTQLITPTKTILFGDIFVDPYAFPNSYELTAAGRDLLKKELEVFTEFRMPYLLVQAHTDTKGSSENNQIESLQRAKTIKQFLSEIMGFDKERIIAIGMGESEPPSEQFLPGYRDRARRIVIKAKNKL